VQKFQTYKYLTWGVMGTAAAAGLGYVIAVGQRVDPILMGLIVAVGVAGLVVNRLVANWHWKAVGREVGLTPAEDGLPRSTLSHDDDALIGKTILSGRIRGQAVRARVYTRTKEDEDDDIDSDTDTTESTTYTVVEVDLRLAPDEGAIVTQTHGKLMDVAEGTSTVRDGPFAVLADEEAHAEAITSGDAREALLAVDDFTHLFVGDAETTLEAATPNVGEKVPDIAGFSVGSTVQSGLEHVVGWLVIGDGRTVTHRTEGVILDPDELERQVEMVVTVAEAFEEALRADKRAG